MMMFPKLMTMVKRHEGKELFPYECTAGKLTIGYGRNLEDVGISEDEADYLLENDIDRARNEVLSIFHSSLPGYTENRQIAMINMMFNLGKTRFMKFRKMIAAIHSGDWESAANEATDSRWYKQVKGRAVEIVGLIREG